MQGKLLPKKEQSTVWKTTQQREENSRDLQRTAEIQQQQNTQVMKSAKHRNWYFSKDEIQWQIYSEKYVREMQMKPQWGSPNSSENGLLHESIDKNCCRRCGENGSRICCWWEHKLVQTLQKSRWRLLRQLEYRSMVRLSYPTPGLYTNKMKYANELMVINLMFTTDAPQQMNG